MSQLGNQPLPSLVALRAFEATARHRSMTRAAEELCVTHGAVSRHIKALEATLGVPLVARGGGASEPTPEGQRLAEGLSTAFGLIHATLDRLRPGPLTLSCSASIMLCWLIPRMAGFHRRNPDVQVELNMNYDKVDFSRDNISVAIRSSTIVPPRDAIIRELGTEWIGPVCSPDYLAGRDLTAPEDLGSAHLLSTNTRPEAWRDWAQATGNGDLGLKAQRSFEHFYLLIQAAACGLGVAVVPHMLALSELQSGRLIAPFGFVPGGRHLRMWIAPQVAFRSDLRALESWLLGEMRSFGRPPDPALAAVRP
ncbi:LysR substrate-binding domain-containing protein [Xanthobacter autotrophicus]|uniref:LysR substrate-binding domain-containing protein n=1 Tax=Xanthobacter autotrophicus TaxID=280 RepID=UPI00372B52DD